MIATLRGEVLCKSKSKDAVILDVRGKGYRVRMPTPFLAEVKVGQDLFCYTHLTVQKTGWTLFGFKTQTEVEFFELLLTVQKVGPRVALAALSSMKPSALADAITSGRADLLTHIPGVGQKTAQRIVLDLKGKVGDYATGMVPTVRRDHAEAISALMTLGYTAAEGLDALKDLDSKLPLDEKIFTALQRLSR